MQSLLGEMYYWGKQGIQRDLKQAVKFYEMGAASGDPQGLFNLGITKLKVDITLYQSPILVPISISTSARYF